MKKNLTPLIISASIVLGMCIGVFYSNHFSGNRLNIINTGSNKLNYLLQLIDNNYVDTVNINDLVENAMPQILSELDPHSAYIPAKDAEEASEDLKGSFSGIGVTFSMIKDTAQVMSVIHGGPAEEVGVQAGDRIIKADGISLVKMDNNEIVKHLKGEKGSKVKLTIKRQGQEREKSITVIRGDIPLKSIDVAYLADKNIGYIKVKKFGEQTYGEFLTSLASLSMKGMKELIIDLRGNVGGYMHIAIQMVNEFLPEGNLIVYTQGRKSNRENFFANGRGTFLKTPIVVLIDEMSASASEIFAGAIQDNDRGTIVGRRSFGKGLVQQPMEFRDGSVVRLTIARYYTPSGRCIQKPYIKGHDEDYENDLIMRYERGEFFSIDSIHQEGEQYKTCIGRTVYGGGGIMPDIFIGEDTTSVTSYYREAIYRGLVRQFAFEFTDQNRESLRKYNTYSKLAEFLDKQNIVEKFAQYAQKNGLARRNVMLNKSYVLFNRLITSSIIYNTLDASEYQKYANTYDPTVQEAINVLKENRSYPVAPIVKEEVDGE